jgi:ankyrin repeat protein
MAAGAGNLALLEMLLAAGARRELDRALFYSCGEDGSPECLGALLDAGANPSPPEPPDPGDSPRALALHHSKAACLEILRERTPATTLIDAAIDGNEEVLSTLLQQGAPVEHQLTSNVTALSGAAAMGHEHVVAKLLEVGADPNLASFVTRTPIARALRAGHFRVARRLQEAGAIIGTGLSHLIGRGCPEDIWMWALDKSQPKSPEDLLCRASLSGDMAATRALLSHGADPDGRDAWGRTPLMIGAWANTPGTARLLLEAGANPQGTDTHGRPLLHYAFTYDDYSPDWADPDFDPDTYLRDETMLQSETVTLLRAAGAKLPWESEEPDSDV